MKASAAVKITLNVTLTQSWSHKATVEEIIAQASREAAITVAYMIEGFANVSMVDKPVVKIIYQTEGD